MGVKGVLERRRLLARSLAQMEAGWGVDGTGGVEEVELAVDEEFADRGVIRCGVGGEVRLAGSGDEIDVIEVVRVGFSELMRTGWQGVLDDAIGSHLLSAINLDVGCRFVETKYKGHLLGSGEAYGR